MATSNDDGDAGVGDNDEGGNDDGVGNDEGDSDDGGDDGEGMMYEVGSVWIILF